MPDLIPFAVIHIGVSVALAAILILVYQRLHRADFLLYWAIFWLAIAANLAATRVGNPVFPAGARVFIAFGISLTPFYPVLMICAALSLGEGLSKRTAQVWLACTAALSVAIAVYVFVRPPAPHTISPFVTYRPLLTSVAVAFFTCCMVLKGKPEAGSTWPALIVLSLFYGVHNLALGSSPPGLRALYPPGGYAPWSATVGILFQFGLTIVFTYSAIERAGEATRQARESDRRLRSLLESVGVAGLIVDRQGRVEFCNRWLVEALEQPPETIVGSSWFGSYVPEDERRQVREVFEAGIQTGNWPAIFEYPIQSGRRELILQWYHTSLRDTAGAIVGAASLGLDLSQQRLLEERIRQGEKMETLGQLAGGVAHDFNNNLTVINGVADMLLRKFPPADPVYRQLKDIRDSGELAATLTRQLLTFSRKRKGDPRPVSLNETVKNNELMLRRLIREDIVLEIEAAPNLGWTMADPGQLDQILLNLVVNANDAISGPGRIRLRTGRFTREDAGEFVVLSVEDSGSGMSDRTRLRIFEPFFTTKAEGKGTGLGLASVHGAVVQAGGWIDVKSQLGAGSVFTVYLPRVDTPQPKEAERAAMPASAPNPTTVLLVEDQEMVRRFAVAVLQDRGYRVLEASNGVEALRIADDASLNISVLVTDVVMPKMSGDELAQRLEESHPGLRTLFVSGYAFDHQLGTDQPSGSRAFLRKPYTPEEFCNQVARLVNATATR